MKLTGDADRVIDAPHVATIANALMRRPFHASRRPFPVDPQLWADARQEMASLVRDRGWSLCEDPALGKPNFLVLGTPIYAAESIDG